MIAGFIASWLAVMGVVVAWHLDSRRRDQLMRDVLERISTEPRIEFRAVASPAPTPPDARTYIADHEADDAAWNEYRGEPQEEAE